MTATPTVLSLSPFCLAISFWLGWFGTFASAFHPSYSTHYYNHHNNHNHRKVYHDPRAGGCGVGVGGVAKTATTILRAQQQQQQQHQEEEVVDVVVIGSGIGGLSCAALLAASGRSVKVLETHYELGGCAHEYAVDLETGRTIPSAALTDQKVFRFEAGPSLYSGLSQDRSANPLKHIYQMIDEEPEWITYDLWGAYLPEAPEGYEMSIGADNFLKILKDYGGQGAVDDWKKLSQVLRPMAGGIMGLPSTAIRGDAGILLTLGARYPGAFFGVLQYASQITEPFDLEKLGVRNEFLKNYLDLLAFLLQGLPADQTLTAVMAYMVEDFYREDAVMDFPKGGSGALIAALARGVTKHDGCSVEVSSTVSKIIVEDDRAVGVRLQNGDRIIRAKEAVISNADLYHTYQFVDKGIHEGFDQEREIFFSAATPKDGSVPFCKSFMHVHLGVKAELIPEDAPPQWTVVKDWSLGIDAPGNVVVVSVPSKLDPSLAPPGYHAIHSYTAGNEPYEDWERFEHLVDDAAARKKDKAYQAFKAERAQPIWDAIAKRAPAVKPGAAVVEQVATPITHARFLTRYRGNYGLAIAPGNQEGWKFPQVTTPIKGLYRCGDSTTAGIGVPAVASSGAQCANAILSVWEQLKLNSKIRM
jgi:phytoene dehydrogenase-like protein